MISYITSFFWLVFVIGMHFPDSNIIHYNPSIKPDQSTTRHDEVSGILERDTVKIGFIIEKEDKLGLMAIRGAEMALEEANKNGGNESNLFQIIVRDCEGPWGMTSKEVASLVYDEEVRVVMASLDGRNAHLVEQVTTKTHIPVVSTRATEATLTQAFSPWYFRCVPGDKQQAKLLYEEIFIKNGFRKIGIIMSENYEDQFSANEFNKYITAQGYSSDNTITIQYHIDDFDSDLESLRDPKIDAIVIFCGRSLSDDLIELMLGKGIKTNTYTDLSFTSTGLGREHLKFIVPASWYDRKGEVFKKQYLSRYDDEPGLAAAYAYDGLNLIIKAISIAGLDREAIKEELARIVYSNGITGRIKFDENGNREELPMIMEIKNGKPERVK